ncbi:hypothetical protein [Granulosicoccus antarcticus]|uniref:Uncharacterized protein n=1 Tax=Granulosicoccus antarcticus IMCC3135 TaxID=1192854 RepID=A0A2Z2NJZ1_9GAMM|nr:hypothetical protein [Granulosicoccus antarcticus]ASJ71616.1 hypothetical protein IMCC3135_07555 [Granulosicoccus antarcticus IMCC3135]
MKKHLRKSAVTLLAIGANLLSNNIVLAEDAYHLEENGVIVFDVESEPADGDWQLGTERLDSLGDGYYQWEGENGGPGRGTMRYHFTVQTPGNYQIRLRSLIGKGENNTEHNDSWIRMPSGVDIPEEEPLDGWTKIYQNIFPAAWTWDTRTVDFDSRVVRQCFPAGDHYIELSGRSNGHAIDRIALYRYDEVNYSQAAFDELPLSAVSETASGIDGSNSTDCDFEITEEPIIEPLEPITQVDIEIEPDTGQCLIDTVLLKSTLDGQDINGMLSSTELLEVAYLDRRALIKFDTSLVPAATEAYLNFTTANNAGEGQISVYLGSHSDWDHAADQDEDNQSSIPDSSALIGSVTGSWIANTRHQIALDASLLQSGFITLIIEMSQAVDAFSIVSSETAEAAPALLIAGGQQFCATYDNNVLQANPPEVVQPEPVVEPPIDPEPVDSLEPVEPINPPVTQEPVDPTDTKEPFVEITDSEESANANTKNSGGAGSFWLLLPLGYFSYYRRTRSALPVKQH